QQQMRWWVVLPIAEDLAGLGQGHIIDDAVAIAAAGGEGAVEAAEPGAGIGSAIVAERAISPGVTRGSASPTGDNPALCRIAATAVSIRRDSHRDRAPPRG